MQSLKKISGRETTCYLCVWFNSMYFQYIKAIFIIVDFTNAWARWAVALGPHANLGMLCMACYLMFKH